MDSQSPDAVCATLFDLRACLPVSGRAKAPALGGGLEFPGIAGGIDQIQ